MPFKLNILIALCFGLLAAGCVFWKQGENDKQYVDSELTSSEAEFIVAGGCFWCVEADFDKVDGVLATISGYTGGDVDNPTYKQVSNTDTGHYEAVRIVYDPSVVSYEELLDYYWRHVDPTDAGGQFCDRGDSYRTAVFVADEEERKLAEASKTEIEQSGVLPGDVVTPILDAKTFWPAENYHQNYYQTHPIRYTYYRNACGRDGRIKEVWGK